MDGLISMGIAVVVVLAIGAIIAFYFGGVWERFTSDTESRIEDRRRREEGQEEELR
jgi:uncharacterized membrane protein YqiK